jgi:hypothetical protein
VTFLVVLLRIPVVVQHDDIRLCLKAQDCTHLTYRLPTLVRRRIFRVVDNPAKLRIHIHRAGLDSQIDHQLIMIMMLIRNLDHDPSFSYISVHLFFEASFAHSW